MKIGIIAYDLSTLAGGTQLSLTLGNELQKEGYEVAYACVHEDLKNLSKKFDIKSNFEIYKKRRPIFGRTMVNYNSMLNHSFPIYKMCKEFKPDAVIETGDFPCSLVIPTLLKIPTIHYAIETSYMYYTKNALNKLYFMPLQPIEKMITKKAKVCTICDVTAKIIQRIWNVDSTVIYPPVDTDVFAAGEKKENIILCVLRYLAAYKFENMIDAFRDLKRDDYSLIVIGGVDSKNEGYYDSLERYTKKDSNIKLIANADFDLLIECYKKSKFFWLPIAPYYSIAVAEAQSCGLPTISIDAGSGPREIIINGKTGYLLDNFDEMIEKTKLLIDDESLWKSMSIAARENAVERFGLNVFRNKFREVIEEVKNAR